MRESNPAEFLTMNHWTTSDECRTSSREDVPAESIEKIAERVIPILNNGEALPLGRFSWKLDHFEARKNTKAPPDVYGVTISHESAGDIVEVCISTGRASDDTGWSYAWRRSPELLEIPPQLDGAWCVNTPIPDGMSRIPNEDQEAATWIKEFAEGLSWAIIDAHFTSDKVTIH